MIQFKLFTPDNIRDIINRKSSTIVSHTILTLQNNPNSKINENMDPEDMILGLDYYNGIIVNRNSSKVNVTKRGIIYCRVLNIFGNIVPTNNVVIIERYDNIKVDEILYVINYFAGNSIIILEPNENMPLGKIVNKELELGDIKFRVVCFGGQYYYLLCNLATINWLETKGTNYTSINYLYDGKGKDQSCELNSTISYMDYRDKTNQLYDVFVNDIDITSYGRDLHSALEHYFEILKELKRIIDISYNNLINGRIKILDSQNDYCDLEIERYRDYYTGENVTKPKVSVTINETIKEINQEMNIQEE